MDTQASKVQTASEYGHISISQLYKLCYACSLTLSQHDKNYVGHWDCTDL